MRHRLERTVTTAAVAVVAALSVAPPAAAQGSEVELQLREINTKLDRGGKDGWDKLPAVAPLVGVCAGGRSRQTSRRSASEAHQVAVRHSRGGASVVVDLARRFACGEDLHATLRLLRALMMPIQLKGR